MTWLLPRVLAAVVAMAVGAALGSRLSERADAWSLGLLLGGMCAVTAIVLREISSGYRLLKWLRGSQEGPAPRDAGLWGELGYRIERALHLREQDTARERMRLTQFLAAIEASPNGVMLLDRHDQIEWCSAVAADHFGIDPERDRRQRVTNLVRAPAFVAYLKAQAFDAAVQMPDPRGLRVLSVLVRPYGGDSKLVLTQDITERERNEGMRRDFVANVSHEIRTPLTVLAGFIETLAELPLAEAERKRVLVLMAQQSERMKALVSDLLTLARLEGSPRPTTDHWVALQPLLAQVQADAQALSAQRHTLVFSGDAEVQIAGAHSELLSGINNLVHNAIRYTPAGGRIEVGWLRQGDGTGVIAVSDNGPGIAREHLARLGERFYRIDSSRSRETGGTGLGLAITKHVALRHGGQLEMQSEMGRGSCFRLVFPAVRVRHAGATLPAAPLDPQAAE
ncbi:MAG TPA: phosphate regulon sensor histidine kinase PhoR [Burkholderiaceae bacterium]|nr:phosphate regulon sensor histidine kinase PhoR [Burkholderiaceae bacterium]